MHTMHSAVSTKITLFRPDALPSPTTAGKCSNSPIYPSVEYVAFHGLPSPITHHWPSFRFRFLLLCL
jgi:hypothetical protein